jgi:hypothetical protein
MIVINNTGNMIDTVLHLKALVGIKGPKATDSLRIKFTSFNFPCNKLFYWLKNWMDFCIHRSVTQYSNVAKYSKITEYIEYKQIIQNKTFYSIISMI